MFEKKKKPEDANQPKTSHTTNLVPFYFYNVDVKLKEGNFGLANIAATITDLLDVEANPVWEESMIVK